MLDTSQFQSIKKLNWITHCLILLHRSFKLIYILRKIPLKSYWLLRESFLDQIYLVIFHFPLHTHPLQDFTIEQNDLFFVWFIEIQELTGKIYQSSIKGRNKFWICFVNDHRRKYFALFGYTLLLHYIQLHYWGISWFLLYRFEQFP